MSRSEVRTAMKKACDSLIIGGGVCPHLVYALASQPPTGGLLLGGGGLGMPMRKSSPVAFLFHRTR